MSVSVMKKLTVISDAGDSDSIIKTLMRQRCVEVRASQSDEYGYLLKKINCDTRKTEIEKKIATLGKIMPVLTKMTKRRGGLGDNRQRVNREEFVSDGRYERAWEKAYEAESALAKIAECKSDIKTCDSEISALSPWLDYDVDMDYLGSKHTDVLLGTLSANVKFSEIQSVAERFLCEIELVNQESSGYYVSIISHKEHTAALLRELTPFGFLRVAFKGAEDTPKETTKKLEERRRELVLEISVLDGVLHECSDSLDEIEVLWDIEQTNLVIVTSLQKTGKTENCMILSAWLPEKSADKVSHTLDGRQCAYGVYDPLPGEEPPIHLDNNKFARNFEWVVGMYSYPKYGSFDPTFIMSIFYFFMFGLMFADVGYGLVLTLGGLLLPKVMKLSPGMKRSFYMFGYCGISSMIMGFIFGGWFGDLPYAIMQNMMGIENAKEVAPIFNGFWFNPIDEPMTFLIVALAVGVVHLLAGMIIQFVMLCRRGAVVAAIFDIGSWWIIFAGLAVIFLVGTTPGLIVCGVGVLMIVFMKARDQKNPIMRILKGLLGLYDITSYASDLLSYSRILALGLASAVVAQVINLIVTMMGPTMGGFVVFIIASIIGHLLNLAINVLGAFVHTSRLQYLEFFGKFYEDGGEEFKAVEPSEKYTID